MMKSTDSPTRPSVPGLLILGLVLALVCPTPAESAVSTIRSSMGDGLVAALDGDHRIWVEAVPLAGEGLLRMSRRLTGGETAAPEIARLNGGSTILEAGVRYRVPYDLLRPELQVRAVEALFSDDRFDEEEKGWRHRVRGIGALERESLWHLALWFTGRGENFSKIRAANDLNGEELSRGDVVTIPADLLLPAFRRAAPPRLPQAGKDYDLSYRSDAGGDYAVYKLRAGEALYSSVVVRFTGRVLAVDVNALAHEIADLSGIRDVTDIPVGYEIKVPMDLLLPEYLPVNHPRRRQYEQSLQASSAYSNEVRSRDLAGITVVLDAGHGGVDVGASKDGVWESLYVYDVVLRLKRILETQTAARVHLTTRDGARFDIPERDVLPFSRDHVVLTDPPYRIEDSAVGVNLRWYLANSIYRRTVAGPTAPDQVVFLSIHGDSLHPSLRGMMAYIPGAELIGGGYGKSGPAYASRREYREQPRVAFSYSEKVRSEGLSRELAERIVDAFRGQGLPIHPYKPVREKIIRRRGQEWVPAVLRYNEVPAKALIEIANLANGEDRRLLQTRAYRERIARALADGLLGYYAEGDAGLPSVVTAAR